ncbi:MAG: peptidoglycan DD-metalloendopeptidase family protein [Xanthomonadales bacterium]|nr:peptidoglycan DD-metalloendopeptidase family protein [Xanthomonadales bacterium]MDH4000548.1 peptidoglycan DD-metalloendopeptidase family protein [Xanthomonadales bacterium]
MKRTSAQGRIASFMDFWRIDGLMGFRRTLWVAVAVFCGGLMFFLGRSTAPGPEDFARQVAELQAEVMQQQGKVDRLRISHQRNVNALAARLAELQAASTRLDALGERLAHLGQLTLDEFNFGEPAPVGGPGNYREMDPAYEEHLERSVAALGDKLRRQSSQLDALQSLMANRQLENDLTPTGWPVRKGWISSRFGERNDPFTGKRDYHNGLDFAGVRGTEVLSVASGVVIWAGSLNGYGKTLEIDHGNGYRTRYAHSDELVVEVGDHVIAGQVIAKLGSTGRSSAPHVHFEVLKDGSHINPGRFVRNLR